MSLKPYNELVKLDVLPFCEYRSDKTRQIPYLNWAKCIELLHENGAEKVYYQPILSDKGHPLHMTDLEFGESGNRCYEVRVRVFIDENTYELSYPLINGMYVIDGKGVNQRAIHTALARAFVKCVAIHTGLGFDLWVKGGDGEDAMGDDLHSHDIWAIKKRIEQLVTVKIDNGKEMRDIYRHLHITEKQYNSIMGYFNTINNLEKMLKEL